VIKPDAWTGLWRHLSRSLGGEASDVHTFYHSMQATFSSSETLRSLTLRAQFPPCARRAAVSAGGRAARMHPGSAGAETDFACGSRRRVTKAAPARGTCQMPQGLRRSDSRRAQVIASVGSDWLEGTAPALEADAASHLGTSSPLPPIADRIRPTHRRPKLCARAARGFLPVRRAHRVLPRWCLLCRATRCQGAAAAARHALVYRASLRSIRPRDIWTFFFTATR
jgi:hypothetical protein